MSLVFSGVAGIALVAARREQFQQLLNARVIFILNFTRPHAITYTNWENMTVFLISKEPISTRSINLEIILFYRDFCISLFFQVLEKRNFKNFRNFYGVLSTLFFFTFGVEGGGEFRSLSNLVSSNPERTNFNEKNKFRKYTFLSQALFYTISFVFGRPCLFYMLCSLWNVCQVNLIM